MNKPTYQDKIELLERYIQLPQAMSDPEVLRSIKSDVVKAHSTPVKRGVKQRDQGAEATVSNTENALYNSAMGVYRQFVASRGGHVDMTGRKAADNSTAMREIITYLRDFMRANNMPNDDAHVLEGIKLMFNNWDRLNDWLKGRIELKQINQNKAEILLKIRNGADKKTTAKDELQQFKQSLTGR